MFRLAKDGLCAQEAYFEEVHGAKVGNAVLVARYLAAALPNPAASHVKMRHQSSWLPLVEKNETVHWIFAHSQCTASSWKSFA
jgi:hypothetical protein